MNWWQGILFGVALGILGFSSLVGVLWIWGEPFQNAIVIAVKVVASIGLVLVLIICISAAFLWSTEA